MIVKKIWLVIIVLFISLFGFNAIASDHPELKNNIAHISIHTSNLIHNDSIHQLNFRYADYERGLSPFIAPAILITGGTILHFSDAKYNINDWTSEHLSYSGHIDDYLRFAPLAATYALNAMGVKGKNNFGNLTAISIKSFVLNDLIVYSLKKGVNEERPNGDPHSFPSGHTSVAFAFAQIMHHEYGDQSIWYSIGAYTAATTVGLMRVAKGSHWASDVLVGAGIGMMSTELIYLTHQYKWDWEHVKRFDIFPFALGPQKGLTLVYNF